MAETKDRIGTNSYEAAMIEALAERSRISEELLSEYEHIAALELKQERLSKFIDASLNLLSPERRALYEQRAEANIQGSARGGVVHTAVLSLLRTARARDWTAQSMQEALTLRNVTCDIKQIYNTLSYLEREGKLKRTSRGRYLYVGPTDEKDPEDNDPLQQFRHPHYRDCDD